VEKQWKGEEDGVREEAGQGGQWVAETVREGEDGSKVEMEEEGVVQEWRPWPEVRRSYAKTRGQQVNMKRHLSVGSGGFNLFFLYEKNYYNIQHLCLYVIF
jgi:hypothetical protein